MKKFDIPSHYRSSITGRVKEARRVQDPRKKDFKPTLLDFGTVQFFIARHFGFCYGVENAIEISYRALEENPGKRVYLLSQMIHNPLVNKDLTERGIRFIMDTDGTQFIPWEELRPEDVVIVPAFGTTLEIKQRLEGLGLEIKTYNTTCPFVEKVWNRSSKLGQKGYTIIIHGKHGHEETKATFSHSKENAPSLVIRDLQEAEKLGKIITGDLAVGSFHELFEGRFSVGFDPKEDLVKVGVVNQTTMLATDTQAIADHIKQVMQKKYGEAGLKEHFADTRDTLCYATNDNQDATYGLLEEDADLAIVVGGYNSSNTSHIVELCERNFPTYFVNSPTEIKSKEEIHHFNYPKKQMEVTRDFLPEKEPLKIVLTSGASCPDTLVDEVMLRLLGFYEGLRPLGEVMEDFTQ